MPPVTSSSLEPTLDAEARREKIVGTVGDLTSKAYDKATAYMNVIILAGYASVFTLWNFTRNQLTSKATIVIALCLIISLLFFILFEIFKMILTSRAMLAYRKVLDASLSLDDFEAAVQSAKKVEQVNIVLMIPIWIVVLIICIATALSAASLLIYNFTAILTDLPLWPR